MALGIHDEHRPEPPGLWRRFVIELSASLLAKFLIELLFPTCAVLAVIGWHVIIVSSILHIPDARPTLEDRIDSPGQFTNARVRSSGFIAVHLRRTPIPSQTADDPASVSLLEQAIEDLQQQVLRRTNDYINAAGRAQQLQEVLDGTTQPTRIGFFADRYEVWQSPAPRYEFVGEDIELSLKGNTPLTTAPNWAFERCDDNVEPEPTGGDAGPVFIFSVPAKTRCRVTISYFDGETLHDGRYWVNIRRSRSDEIRADLR